MPARNMPEKKPNFLIVVADDLGFSDTGPYGSEIATPNLDWLAKEGLRMTDFHTAPTCSPTRAMLFSGTDNHIAGLGVMWEQHKGLPQTYDGRRGFEGYLNFDVAAMPEFFADNGYFTTLSGKWHLGLKSDIAPHARGFQKCFTYLAGAGSHYNHEPQLETGEPKIPSLTGTNMWMENDRVLDRETELPKDFYSTKTFTDKLLQYMGERTEEEKEKPFLAALTFTAPHWPLQAPEEVIQKYRGMYDDGPDELRKRRLERLTKLGIIKDGVEPAACVPNGTAPWEKLTEEERQKSSRSMEVFAAMVDQIDEHTGRVFDYLRSTGELDNTFVIFMSDNGAEGQVLEAFPVMNGANLAEVITKYYDNSLENMGSATSYVWYGPRWANAATAPSRGYKSSTFEGGIRCPCIVRYPPGIAHPAGSTTHQFTNVMDIMPTMLDLAGLPHPYPNTFRGRDVVSMRGKSWAQFLAQKDQYVYNEEFDYTGWELFGCRAVRKGKWKALLMPAPKSTGEWQLYDLQKDPGEIHDLAEQEPAKLKELIAHYEVYYQETGMFDVGLAVDMRQKKAMKVRRPNAISGLHGFRG